MGIMSRRRRAAKDTQVMSPGSTNQATKLKKCSQLAHGSDPRRSMPGSRDGVVAAGLPPTASITAARGWPGRQRQSPRARPRIRGSAPGKAEMADRQTGWGRRNASSADKTVGRVRPSEHLDILSSASSPERLFKRERLERWLQFQPPPQCPEDGGVVAKSAHCASCLLVGTSRGGCCLARLKGPCSSVCRPRGGGDEGTLVDGGPAVVQRQSQSVDGQVPEQRTGRQSKTWVMSSSVN